MNRIVCATHNPPKPKDKRSRLSRNRSIHNSSVRSNIGHLLLPHAVVQPAGTHQLLVCTLFDDLAVFQDDDEVCQPREDHVTTAKKCEKTYRLPRPCAGGVR